VPADSPHDASHGRVDDVHRARPDDEGVRVAEARPDEPEAPAGRLKRTTRRVADSTTSIVPSAATSRPRGLPTVISVVIAPVRGSIRRTRSCPVSETSTAPSAATAIPRGSRTSVATGTGRPAPPARR
jgi:hypothetical protein